MSLTENKIPVFNKKLHSQGTDLAQMAFPLHPSEISDTSETAREKNVSDPAESSHFFQFKKVLYRRDRNVTFFGKDATKNATS